MLIVSFEGKVKKMSVEKKTFRVIIQDNKTGKTLYYSADSKSSYFLPYKKSATNFANVEDLEKKLPFIKEICSTFYNNPRYGEIKILETIVIADEIEHESLESTKLPYLEKESKKESPREQLGVEPIDNSKNGLVKAFEQERDEFHQVYTKLTSMIPAYVSGDAEFKMYNLLDTLENLYNKQKHSNPSTQKGNETYYVHTCEENDGYNAKHEYKFSNKEEFLKFVRGEMAIDEWGDNCKRSYYEHIEEAYTKVDIDVTTSYQMDVTDSYDIDYEK